MTGDNFFFRPARKLRSLLVNNDQPFIHRDLSWLQFNSRVLDEADLETNPLLERVKFLSISSSNLDEFFMIRIASLGRGIAAEMRRRDGKQLQRLRRVRSVTLGHVRQYFKAQAKTLGELASELLYAQIQIVTDPRKSEEILSIAKRVFEEQVFPELSAPEPYGMADLERLENLQFAVFFQDGTFIRVPKKIRSVLTTKTSQDHENFYFFFLDHLLEIFLASSLGVSLDPVILRLTRDADLTVDLEEEDPESIPDVVLSNLSTRERGRPVRIQYRGNIPAKFLRIVRRAFKLSRQQVFEMPNTICLHGLWSAIGEIPPQIKENKGLTYPSLKPPVPRNFHRSNDSFEVLRSRDFLLHHPYDSFEAYVNWVLRACEDPHTTMIQQTIYRMDALSPVIDALKAAAKHKKVRLIIELRARFDEFNNLRLAEDLRRSGIEVIFGFGKLKLHAKVALITRTEGSQTKLYTHLSTGNYNSITARQYTDLAILTANEEIGQDALHFFDSVSKHEIPHSFKRLVHAPTRLHRKILNLIETEISAAKLGKKARIVVKVNALVDKTVVDQLYRASRAGVKVDLIVRGACALVPGIKGLSENIRVFSIVDRFLEHSRIYYFESSNTLYLSSADWMPRNFFSRLELAFPVLDPRLHQYITDVLLSAYLSDRAKARELFPDGTWRKRQAPSEGSTVRAQFYFEELAEQEYRGTPLEIE